MVARLVRTAEQANVAQSILAMVLGIAGGAFFPGALVDPRAYAPIAAGPRPGATGRGERESLA